MTKRTANAVRRMSVMGLATVPLLLARCGCGGGAGGGVLPGDLGDGAVGSGSYHGCSFEIEFGVDRSPYAQTRQTAGSCRQLSAQVTGSTPPSGAQLWASTPTGQWLQVTAGGADIGGASFTIFADDGCSVHLQYYGESGNRGVVADSCA